MARAYFSMGLAAALTLLATGPVVARTPMGPEAADCRPGATGSAILVNVHGFRRQTGFIRVQVHGGNAATWLGKGTHLKRIELPVTAASMPVCVKLPGPGRYAVAVRHDEDGDKKFTRKDGGGYSGNPRLSAFHLKSTYAESSFAVDEGVKPVDVVLNYLYGLTIRPVG